MALHWTYHQRRRTLILLTLHGWSLGQSKPLCVEKWPLKNCLKPTSTKWEPESCSLVVAICDTFSCQKFSHKTYADFPKHVHFGLSSYDPICVKRPASFPELDFKSTYISRFNPSGQLLYHIAVPTITQEEPRPDDTCFWSNAPSDELLLYEVTAQFWDEEQEDKMNTSEPPVTVYLQDMGHIMWAAW